MFRDTFKTQRVIRNFYSIAYTSEQHGNKIFHACHCQSASNVRTFYTIQSYEKKEKRRDKTLAVPSVSIKIQSPISETSSWKKQQGWTER